MFFLQREVILRDLQTNELALHVTDGDGKLIDLEVTEDNLTLEEEHLSLLSVPLVEILLADLLEVICGSAVKIGFGSTTFGNDTETLLGLALLLLLQLLCCFLAEQGAKLLLALRSHESLLLSHFDVCCFMCCSAMTRRRSS